MADHPIYGMTKMGCGECGIEFAVPDSFYKERRERGSALSWYCPNGHSRVFRESEADKLRRERDQLKQRQAMLEDEARQARERAEKAEATTKRLKKRAAGGACPCCKRTFANMARHMKQQHPTFAAEAVNVVPLKQPAQGR